MTELNDTKKAMTVEYRFAVAVLKHKMNATAAAMEVFEAGKKSGKNPRASAQAMGSRMLRNVMVQQHLTELSLMHLDIQGAVRCLNELVKSKDNPRVAFKSAVLILRIAGIGPAPKSRNSKASDCPEVRFVTC